MTDLEPQTVPHVLVVDDDEMIQVMLEAALAPDWRVTGHSGGQAALDWLATNPVDAVVLDVEMPGLDGYATCRALRAGEDTGDLPVLFHSAHTDLDERLKGYAAGGDDYLPKPFDPVELRAKLVRLVAQRTKERNRSSRQQQDMAGQLDEMINAVLSSADMVGEAGVVLDFQRQLTRCADLVAVGHCLMEALGRYQLEGCVRLRNGRGVEHATNGRTQTCSALEVSILDHMDQLKEGPRIRPFGQHTGFAYGSVALFVRNLRMQRPDDMDRQEAERHGRHIDNVALLVEGALTRVAALDAERAGHELASARELVDLTRNALADISAQGHAQRLQIAQVLTHLGEQFENAFLSLGLTQQQEDFLMDTLRERTTEVMGALDQSQVVERRLLEVIRQLDAQA